MSETATETVEPEAEVSEPVVAEVAKPTVNLDSFGNDALKRLADNIVEFNGINTQIKAAQGTPEELLEALKDTYTDNGGPIDKLQDQAQKLDKALDQVVSQINEALKPIVVKMQSETEANIQPQLDRAAALGKVIKSGRDYISGLYPDQAEAALATLPDVQRTRKSGGGGTGATRIRGFDFYVNGKIATTKDSENKERSSTSAVAKAVKADTASMQEAFWAAQGTKNKDDFKDEVTYSVTVGDTTYNILARKHADPETSVDVPNAQ